MTKDEIREQFIRPAIQALKRKVERGEPLDDFERSLVDTAVEVDADGVLRRVYDYR